VSRRITHDVGAAARLLRRGGVVAMPTETVYGLGADALNAAAVRRVFAIKRRPADHPLIVHISDAAQLDAWARDIPETARRLAARFWPGPLTLILSRQPQVPDAVTGGQDSVGLRVPGHPVARALLAAFGGGIAAPSANRYGRVSATTAAHVLAEFGEEVDLILDGGACPLGIESTIVSLIEGTPRLLRPGAISPAMLAEALGRPLPLGAGESGVRAPGSHAAHYAPATPLALLPGEALWQEARRLHAAHCRIAVLHRGAPRMAAANDLHLFALPPDAKGYAHDLYATLRAADALGAERLLVEAPPPGEEWLAIRDRLARAATGSAPTAS
jgi:L-threonylcarbamoyladenylate synthase